MALCQPFCLFVAVQSPACAVPPLSTAAAAAAAAAGTFGSKLYCDLSHQVISIKFEGVLNFATAFSLRILRGVSLGLTYRAPCVDP